MTTSTKPQVRLIAPAAGPAALVGPGRAALGGLWLAMTVVTASSAILTRFCDVPASSIGFWRVLGAAVVLAPWWLAAMGRHRPRLPAGRAAALAGLFLGLHLATWAWAILHAHLANAAVFIAIQPALTPLFGRALAGDRLSRAEVVGTAVACAGALSIVGGQVLVAPDQLPGSLVALASTVLCTAYVVIGRRHRARSGHHVLLFAVPVYLAAALTQAGAALALDGRVALPASGAGLLAIAGLALLPTVGGHTLAMHLVRHLKAHTVVLSIPVQFVLVTVAGTLLFGERPRPWFYAGAAVVVTGVLIAILGLSPAAGQAGERA